MQNQSLKQNWKVFFSLFFVIFVDVIGLCIIFPVLAPLVYDTHSALLPAGMSLDARNWMYALLLAIWPICLFFSAPILGDLSDKFGRKKVILLCLFGEGIAYLLGAASVGMQSLTIMILSRIVAGVFAGSQPIAQAAIADISTPENKTRNMSKIVLATTLGVVLGPLIGGFAADGNFASFFSYATPFQIAAVIALLNGVVLIIAFKETHEVNREVKVKLLKSVKLFTDAFKNKKIRIISLVFLGVMISWSIYFQALAYFLINQYDFNTSKIGIFYGTIGVASAAMLSYGINILLKYIKLEYVIYMIGLVAMTIAGFVAAFAHPISWQYVAAMLGAAGVAITYTLSLSFYSNAVDENKQGWVMGISASITGVGWALTAVAIGPLNSINPSLSFVIMAGSAIFCLFVMLGFFKPFLKLQVE